MMIALSDVIISTAVTCRLKRQYCNIWKNYWRGDIGNISDCKVVYFYITWVCKWDEHDHMFAAEPICACALLSFIAQYNSYFLCCFFKFPTLERNSYLNKRSVKRRKPSGNRTVMFR